ncbi:MAG: hypothetical protein OHK0037_14020 [Elainellaceae cyanobacterium]
MLQALQQTVRVGAGGKIELLAPECPEGTEVQVIVLLAPQMESVEALPAQSPEMDEMEIARQRNIAKIQAAVRKYVPEDKSLVDELIAERRAEAEAERE